MCTSSVVWHAKQQTGGYPPQPPPPPPPPHHHGDLITKPLQEQEFYAHHMPQQSYAVYMPPWGTQQTFCIWDTGFAWIWSAVQGVPPPPFLTNLSRQRPGAPVKRHVDLDRGPRRGPLPTNPGSGRAHMQANFRVWLTARGGGHRDTRPPTHRTRRGNACPRTHRERTTRNTGTLEVQRGDQITIEALLLRHRCGCSYVHVTFHL